MKKSVAIVIGIIFIGSIFIINLFGLKMSVYNETITVAKIECINQAKDGVELSETLYRVDGMASTERKKIMQIIIPYEGAADMLNNTGTMFFLETRVYPDNATEKRVNFMNHSNTQDAELYLDTNGEPNGLILFYDRTAIVVKVTTREKNNTTSLYVMIVAK